MLEKAIEKACCAYAKSKGCWALKLWPTVSGLPDRLILLPGGRVWFVEFKTPEGRVSPIQKRVHDKLYRLGFPVSVVRSVSSFKECLDRSLVLL